MLLKKITTGYVIQTFDTNSKKFVAQTFSAGDECSYEDENGNIVSPSKLKDENGDEIYLHYDMFQPCPK